MSSKLECYAREPLSIHEGIPVFSHGDAYVENYKKIASDHVAQITSMQENPFMEEELWKSLERSTRQLITKHVAKGARILDVGVGLGRLLEPLTDFERFGVDISLEYLSIAKARGIEVAMSKIEDLPYKKDFFDAIVVCDVLEHVLDLNFCTERILSCLRPGGILIVRVPFKEDLSAYLNPELPYDFVHLRAFDEASIWLHFHKIFGLQFVESAPTTPYLQGSPRLKLRLIPEETRKRLLTIAAEHPEMKEIESSLMVSEELFQSWLYRVKDQSKELFSKLSQELIFGIELNSVFVKPYDDNRIIKKPALTDNSIAEQSPDSIRYQLHALGRDYLQFKERIDMSFHIAQAETLKSRDSTQQHIAGLSTRQDTTDNAISEIKHAMAAQKSDTDAMKPALFLLQEEVNQIRSDWLIRASRKIKKVVNRFR